MNSEMQLEALIERIWRCTWRPRLSEHGDGLGGHNRASLESTHRPGSSKLREALEGDNRVSWRCTCRPLSSEFGDALGDYNRVNLVAMMEQVWRCTWRP